MIIIKGWHSKAIIATPTKCGTTTIEAVARRHERNGGKDFLLFDGESPRRQHRMVPPLDDFKVKKVESILLVRNPFSRYTSIYEYLRAPANYSQWGAKVVQGSDWGGHGENEWADSPPMLFPQFMAWYHARREDANPRPDLQDPAAYRSPWVWTDSLSDSYNFLQWNMMHRGGDSYIRLLRLENLWDGLAEIAAAHGVQDLDLSPLHSNRSTTRHGLGGEHAVKDEVLEVWHRYYGGDSGLCPPEAFDRLKRSAWSCVNTSAWGGNCPVCAMGVPQEARDLGYIVGPK